MVHEELDWSLRKGYSYDKHRDHVSVIIIITTAEDLPPSNSLVQNYRYPWLGRSVTGESRNNDRDSDAVVFTAMKTLESVLEHFQIAKTPSVEQAFATNIKLFVLTPSM